MREWSQRTARRLAAVCDVQDACLLGGLSLVSVGSYQVYPPAGLLVPGAVLLWLALSPAQRRK
jgi:hypothetical protein